MLNFFCADFFERGVGNMNTETEIGRTEKETAAENETTSEVGIGIEIGSVTEIETGTETATETGIESAKGPGLGRGTVIHLVIGIESLRMQGTPLEPGIEMTSINHHAGWFYLTSYGAFLNINLK